MKIFNTSIALLTAIVLGLRPVRDLDIWWHLASGRWIVDHGQIPHTDVFSYTFLGAPWFHLEWASGVLLWLIHLGAGIGGLVTFKIFIYALILILANHAYKILTRHDGSPLLVVMIGYMILHRMLERPDILGHLFLAVELCCLYAFRHSLNWKKLLPLPFLFLIWANSHGSLLMGLAVFFLFLLGLCLEKNWRDILRPPSSAVGLACLLLPLANPYFSDIYTFPIRHLGMQTIVRDTFEWQSPFHAGWRVLLHIQIYFILVAVVLGWLLIQKKTNAALLLVGAGLAFLSLKSGRFTSYFSLWALPVLWMLISPLQSKIRPHLLRLPKLAAMALLALFTVLGAPVTIMGGFDSMGYGVSRGIAPENAVQFLKERGSPRLFHEMHFGSYLIYSGVPVYFDGRTPIYPETFIEEYLATQFYPRAFQILQQRWGFEAALLSKEHEPYFKALHDFLRKAPKWKLAYEDDVAFVYLHGGL